MTRAGKLVTPVSASVSLSKCLLIARAHGRWTCVVTSVIMHNESCSSWRISCGGAEEWLVPSVPSLNAVGKQIPHSFNITQYEQLPHAMLTSNSKVIVDCVFLPPILQMLAKGNVYL